MAAPIVITDFDGTLARADVFDELCDRFAAPDWREYERLFASGELSMHGAAQWIFDGVNASLAELREYALCVGELRAGASDLFEAARAGRIELVIASGGLGFYIEALLAEHATDRGLSFDSPLGALRCERCAVCKGLAIQKHLHPARRVVYCGDGWGDRCAAGVAPELFAVAGSNLARYCKDRDVPHTEFDDYRQVLEVLGL